MQAIEYFAPASLDEAVRALASHGARARVLAGGTDVIIQALGPVMVPYMSRAIDAIQAHDTTRTSPPNRRTGRRLSPRADSRSVGRSFIELSPTLYLHPESIA